MAIEEVWKWSLNASRIGMWVLLLCYNPINGDREGNIVEVCFHICLNCTFSALLAFHKIKKKRKKLERWRETFGCVCGLNEDLPNILHFSECQNSWYANKNKIIWLKKFKRKHRKIEKRKKAQIDEREKWQLWHESQNFRKEKLQLFPSFSPPPCVWSLFSLSFVHSLSQLRTPNHRKQVLKHSSLLIFSPLFHSLVFSFTSHRQTDRQTHICTRNIDSHQIYTPACSQTLSHILTFFPRVCQHTHVHTRVPECCLHTNRTSGLPRFTHTRTHTLPTKVHTHRKAYTHPHTDSNTHTNLNTNPLARPSFPSYPPFPLSLSIYYIHI